jgi:hypothetical protein
VSEVTTAFQPSRIQARVARRDKTPPSRARQDFRAVFGADAQITLESPSWVVPVGLSGGATVGWDPEGRVGVVLHGELHGEVEASADALARRFRSRGDGLFPSLNGSYALLLVDRDADRVAIVTDRVASRRLFWSRDAGGGWITTRLADQPTARQELDPVAVAWYLANHACYNQRTPFAGVRYLARGHAHDVTPQGLRSTEYWSHLVREPQVPPDPARLEVELADRLVAAVQRRVEGPHDVILSLSGGWDSTAIAVILGEVLGTRDVRSFSYVADASHAKPNDLRREAREKDAHVAAATARRLGLSHRIIHSYAGPLLDHLRLNAALGEGVAPAASEATIWPRLGPELQAAREPVLLVGDQYFGRPTPDAHPDMDAVWAYLFYAGLVIPPWVSHHLPGSLLRTMRAGLEADTHEILSRQPATTDLNCLLDHLNFDHRVLNVILPWRERVAGSFVQVRNPWLDSDVLDFMVSQGMEPRRGKKAFLGAVARLAPGFREFRPATRDAYHPDRAALLRNDQGPLRDWIHASTSRLDEMVPPAFGLALLDGVVDPGSMPWSLPRLWSALRRRATLLPWVAASAKPIYAPNLFMRWATLRMALEP